MKDHSGGKQERKQTERKQTGRPGEKQRNGGSNGDLDRFKADGRERSYDGDSAPDVQPGDGGRGSEERQERESGTEWRDSFGAYGFPGYRESPGDSVQRSGYGEQGFGAGESRGGRWGGGDRGGYGGGEPGGLHGTRGGGWTAAGERYEQGRGPRSYGPEGWGGAQGRSAQGREAPSVQRGGGWGDTAGEPRAQPRPLAGGHDHTGGYREAEAPWRKSEFAGRGEFGERDHGPTAGDSGWEGRSAAGSAHHYAEHWMVPGPYTGRGPEDYIRSEAAIRDDVCERLTRHGQLDASRISVQVENGEVVLDGIVDSRMSKRMAEEAAETVSGVRDIHNRLRIASSDD